MDITIVTRTRFSTHWIGRALGAAGLAGGGILSGVLATAFYVAHRITRPTPITPFDSFTFTPFEFGIPYDAVAVPGVDGVKLPGWWLYRGESSRVVIICIGYRGRRADMLGVAAALWRDGNNVLIFDYRGHGELAGSPVTLGYREVHDLLSAVEWVKSQVSNAAIGVLGYSMGGSVAIMGAARSEDIRAVVADSPFASQREVVGLTVRRVLRVPHGPLLHVVDLLLGHVGGYHFRDVEPLREVPFIAPRPLLLIHGDADSVTDPRDSQALYDMAGEPKELWLVPGVEHCGVYFADRSCYCERLTGFFRRALARQALPDASAAR